MTRRAVVPVFLLVLPLGLTGCAGGLGTKEYACEGLPSRPLCLSTADIYALTDGDGPPPAERRLQQEKSQ
ncbi:MULTISPECIES: conjugal transfer protein TraV [Thiorhodovibrio]|uniref:conjugal transfer protein TraV n=1 Tax=Thiorhodovibrio TaxID=61593 RepID=UPI0019142E2D|nr:MULTISPECIES: conjugal transfer protein TraV [Thiorhodovibrio]MBK5968400.1 conjugal transfer protein TraV [Thiorhodovibrio winogradskyi]WPL13313.1 hypothetical protein Thiosp_03112 [Thiorhodovibrio litoralis]